LAAGWDVYRSPANTGGSHAHMVQGRRRKQVIVLELPRQLMGFVRLQISSWR